MDMVLVVLSPALTAVLIGRNHPTNIDVVPREDLLGVVDGLWWERTAAGQNPGVVHVEQPENFSAGVKQRHGVIIGG